MKAAFTIEHHGHRRNQPSCKRRFEFIQSVARSIHVRISPCVALTTNCFESTSMRLSDLDELQMLMA